MTRYGHAISAMAVASSVFFAIPVMAEEPLVVPSAAQQVPPRGRWKTIDDETGKPKSIVVIWEEKGKLYGSIDTLIPQPGDEENPKCDKCEGDRKDKPIKGMTIMWDLEKDDDEWSGGQILDPKNGKTYKCTIEVVDNGARLKVRGYIGFSLIGRSQYWLREK